MSEKLPAHLPGVPEFKWTQAAATYIARKLARAGCGLEVRGLEHLPADGSCILCANHSSHADTFALATASGSRSRRLVFLGARDYFSKLRWRRHLLERIICLAEFDRRSNAAATMHNLRVLGACRDEGRIVVLFPEGTRSVDGRIAPFKPGAAMFADKLSMKVVPCRIDGAHAILRKGRRLPRPSRLRVSFGAPIEIPAALEGETSSERSARYADFMMEVRTHVVRLGSASEKISGVAS